mmetsp:Transcript_17309/g.47961  ORF Transcript_17309/g.47961 Transcript_17309/m.47961 type:complete len:130 (-) Transcript_17309:644-1033(-)
MSHFTYIKTRFQNLFYLEKALNNINIINNKLYKVPNASDSLQLDIVIPQSNGYDIFFTWTGQEYELLTDLSFWKQTQPIESFIDKLTQQYACELVMGESQKIGFQPINDRVNEDGSTTLILERWNSTNI